MLTLKQLLSKSIDSRRKAATKVRIVNLRTRYSDPVAVRASTYTPGSATGERYDTEITFLYNRHDVPTENVKVTCGCDDFKYTWEYALNHAGAADIIHCNGEPPEEKNPQMIPGLCKHLIAMAVLMVAGSHHTVSGIKKARKK